MPRPRKSSGEDLPFVTVAVRLDPEIHTQMHDLIEHRRVSVQAYASAVLTLAIERDHAAFKDAMERERQRLITEGLTVEVKQMRR